MPAGTSCARGFIWTVRLLLGLGLAVSAPPAAADSGVASETIEEILSVLHERGLIDAEERERLLLKHHAEQGRATSAVASALTEGWEWYGDLRLRYETFLFDKDDLGDDRDNRYRFRYRARIGFDKQINDWISVGMRVASGQDEHRSTNRTLGEGDDFDRDDFDIERAFARIQLPDLGALETRFVGGKIANPFVWKYGRDFVVWDHDISPEGGALQASLPLSEGHRLFANLGYFIDAELDEEADPKVYALQLGGTSELGSGVELGYRGSMYWWRSLDSDFVARAEGFGNLPSAYEPGGKARIGELNAFVKYAWRESWPVLLYGTAIENFSADDDVLMGIPVDDESSAWGIGLEVGSSKRFAKLGAGYFYVEANSVVSLMTDSDLFDGFTNRRGWTFYAARRLVPGVEWRLEYYDSDSIENDWAPLGAPFSNSISNADRKRFRTDLLFSF